MKALEATTMRDVGAKDRKGKPVSTWAQKMDQDIVDHILNHSKYNTASVPELLRFIRNMWTHYKQLPENVKVMKMNFVE